MSDRIHIEGRAFVIAGDVESDAILAPRHHGAPDAAAHCLANRAPGFVQGGPYPVLIATGLFGLGLPRPPVSAALRAAGARAVIAPSIAPLLVENALNGAELLTLAAAPQAWPETGEIVSVTFDATGATLAWPGHESRWPGGLPGWALAGQSWGEVLRARAEAAGGLAALQEARRQATRAAR